MFRSLADIPREQPIRDSLEAINAISQRIRRVKAVTDAMTPSVDAAIGRAVGARFFLLKVTPERLSRARSRIQSQAAKEAGVVAAAAAVAAAKGGAGGGDGDSEEEEAAVVVEPKRVAPTISAPSVPAATKAQKREWRVRGAVHCTQRSWRVAVAPSLLPHLLWTSVCACWVCLYPPPCAGKAAIVGVYRGQGWVDVIGHLRKCGGDDER